MKPSPATEDPDGFTRWALDPARTREEQIALEAFLGNMPRYHLPEDHEAFESPEGQARWQRRLKWRDNPRLVPIVDPVLVERAARVLGKVTEVSFHTWGSGPSVTDLGFTRFLPALEFLMTDYFTETMAAQLAESPCAETALRRLNLSISLDKWPGLARLRALEELYLRCGAPWPCLRGMEELPRLAKLTWHGHSAAFLDVPSLPALMSFHFDCGMGVSAFECLRDFYLLPEMPVLELFWGWPMWRLDGIAERCPQLTQLGVRGHFHSLDPLAGLERLTHLRLSSPEVRRLEPVARLPQLRQFVFLSRRPQDFTPLLEAPALQELHAYGCPAPQPDLAMVQHLLPAWEGCFTAPAPRPFGPLRLRVIPVENKEAPTLPPGAWPDGPEGWDGSLLMRESECHWAHWQIIDALEAAGLYRVRGIDKPRTRHEVTHDHMENSEGSIKEFTAGFAWLSTPPAEGPLRLGIELKGVIALGHMRQVIDTVRPVLARLRLPMQFAILGRGEPDADELDHHWRRRRQTPQERVMEEIEEERDREQRARAEQARMAAELRERLAAEAGLPVPDPDQPPVRHRDDPAPPPAPGELARAFDDPRDSDTPADDGESDSGGIAEAQPGEEEKDEHWLPPPPELHPAINWEALHYVDLILDGDDLWLDGSGWARPAKIEGVEYLLDLPAELAPGETREVKKKE